jgi:hypothetical protein
MHDGEPRNTLRPDTRTLLRTGSWIFGAGLLSVLLLFTSFGGATHQGPHTNGGWLMLILALGFLPIGIMVLGLGIAKLIGDKSR